MADFVQRVPSAASGRSAPAFPMRTAGRTSLERGGIRGAKIAPRIDAPLTPIRGSSNSLCPAAKELTDFVAYHFANMRGVDSYRGPQSWKQGAVVDLDGRAKLSITNTPVVVAVALSCRTRRHHQVDEARRNTESGAADA